MDIQNAYNFQAETPRSLIAETNQDGSIMLNPNDPTGVGGGTIGTGQAPIPGEQGFSGVAQGGQANTQQPQAGGQSPTPSE